MVTVEQRIIEALAKTTEHSEDSIRLDMNPEEELNMDSLAIMNFILLLEEWFDMDFEQFSELSQHMSTVEEMVSFMCNIVEDKLNE